MLEQLCRAGSISGEEWVTSRAETPPQTDVRGVGETEVGGSRGQQDW